MNLEDVKAPHTLGWSSYILLVKFLYIDSAEEVVSLFDVELQKPRNLSAHESEKCEHGKGVGVHATLLQSDTVQPYGRAKAGTRPVEFELRKKPKDLSASEREERGHGKGVSTEDVRESALCT